LESSLLFNSGLKIYKERSGLGSLKWPLIFF
jgi:hypothetical protein